MLGYDYEIIYKKGKQNMVVVSFPRKDEDVEALLCSLSIIEPKWVLEAMKEWKNNLSVWMLIQKLQKDPIV